MTVYVVTGKLGSGKTLASVGRLRDYLRRGRRVATNLDLNLDRLLPARSHATVTRLPDKPRVEDLRQLGTGDDKSLDDYDEAGFGLLVLDELASWFNARAWSDKGRAEVIEWFLHARKYHWDILLIVQDLEAIDKQLRGALCEHLVICRRLDRLTVPLVGGLIKAFTGRRAALPKVHVASVWYGENTSAPKVDRWWYSGRELYAAYRTGQVFSLDNLYTAAGAVDMRASYSLLSAWHLVGRYVERRSWRQVLSDGLARLVAVSVNATAKLTGRSPASLAIAWGVASPALLAEYRRASLLAYGRRLRIEWLGATPGVGGER